jgi:transcriptional regulator with GAF, ATPase, and Fis domain
MRRRAKAPVTQSAENQVSAKLRAAFDALSAVENAIEELPVLTDLRGLTQALVGEVVELLSPQTAAIYLPSPDGFRVWASHGFSNVEKTMAVQTHQPLFADLLVRHESVLIEPLDLAYQLAAGVGGARTNAFLASPIEVNRTCVGVIVAGREHFENEDLDHLEALAEEAAMGLGIALGLDRLRGFLG